MDLRSVPVDRREEYYERAAALIAKDPLSFYTRAEAGRKVQAGVKPGRLLAWTPERLREHWGGNVLHLKAGKAR